MQTINGVNSEQKKFKLKDRLAYSDQQRNNHIMPRINNLTIPDVFKPLVCEICVRRAYEYNLSPAEVERDLRRLETNLKDIKIGRMPRGYKTAAGLYKPDEKAIILRKDYVREKMNEPGGKMVIFQTLAHEISHAMEYDERGYDTLLHANLYTVGTDKPTFNYAIIEDIIEKSSHRLAYSTADERTAPYNTKAKGYTGMTYITDALTAACGVTEKVFMRTAFNGYNKLIDLVSRSTHLPRRDAEVYIDGIDLNAAKLHAIYYPNPTLPKISEEDKPNEIKEALANIESMTRNLFRDRIASREVRRANLPLLTMRDKYSYNKLKDALKEGVDFASWMMGKDFSQELAGNERIQWHDSTLKRAITQEEQVSQSNVKGEDKARLFGWAASGNLNNYHLAKEYFPGLEGKNLNEFGIDPLKEPPKDFFMTTKTDIDYTGRGDFPLSKWYNGRVEQMVETAVNSRRTKNTSLAKTNFFSRFIGRIRGAFGAGKAQEQISEPKPEVKDEVPFYETDEYKEKFGVIDPKNAPSIDKIEGNQSKEIDSTKESKKEDDLEY